MSSDKAAGGRVGRQAEQAPGEPDGVAGAAPAGAGDGVQDGPAPVPVAAQPVSAAPAAAAASEPVLQPAAAPAEGQDGEQHAVGLSDPHQLRAALEAILFVVDSPTSAVLLAQVLDCPQVEVEQALRALRGEYDAAGRGIDLREVAGGWRLYTREDYAGYVERFLLDGQQARLTQASLETLAVVAYRQPITRSRVSAIRGVNVDSVIRTLLGRGLVEECGSDPETGGGLYRTTQLFLEKLGLRSLQELPSLAPLLPDASQLDDVALST